MWIRFCNWFTKITAYPVQFFSFRTRVHYEDRKLFRETKGPVLIVSNHTSVFDYAVYLFVFFRRTIRTVMAELLFEKPVLGVFLRCLGGIRVDRNAHEFGFIEQSVEILKRGGTVLIFPESRLPRATETRPLPFKPSVAVIALHADVPVVPVYTNGSYFSRKRAEVVVGRPVRPAEWIDPALSEKENIERVTEELKRRIVSLGERLL